MKVAGQLFGQNSTQSSLASATAQNHSCRTTRSRAKRPLHGILIS